MSAENTGGPQFRANDFPVPSVEGILTADQVRETVAKIAEWQLPNGMVPWFPGGHADPWNHIEAAMALALGGYRAEAEKAYEWLADMQREDGSWHQYYLEDRVEQDKHDANVIAYIAAGVWHHFLLFNDQAFIDRMWPVVEKAINWVLDLQTPRGEILWARHTDGTPWSFALLTGSSSICHSLRCAIAIAEHLGPTGSCPRRDSPTSSGPTSPAICPMRSPRSTVGPWTGTTRCLRALCATKTASPISMPAATHSSSRTWACVV